MVRTDLRQKFRSPHQTYRRTARQNRGLPRPDPATRRPVSPVRPGSHRPPSRPTLHLSPSHGQQSPRHLRRKLRLRTGHKSRPGPAWTTPSNHYHATTFLEGNSMKKITLTLVLALFFVSGVVAQQN